MKKRLTLLLLMLACVSSLVTAQYGGGTGTSGDPYLITSVSDLAALATAVNGGSNQSGIYFRQTVDLDLNVSPYNSGEGWPCMMNFAGTYDGNSRTISNLFINNTTTENGAGLFAGWMSGTIENLGLINPNVTGVAKNYVGGITGRAYSTALIRNCYVSGGSISGNKYVGPMCGLLNATGRITQCYSSGVTVNGQESIGGIAGYIDGSGTLADNCYSSSSITAAVQYAGGVVGFVCTSASLDKCYANCTTISAPSYTGGVAGGVLTGSVTASFYDNSKFATDNGFGTGKSTTLMQTQSTYTDAGWDFTTIWEMIGVNYPRLKATPEEALPVELASFVAAPGPSQVTLRWTTAVEIDNAGFSVERSRDANGDNGNWVAAGFVAGHGTTNAPQSYSFIDTPGDGTFSYRLKQIDHDGKYTYSGTVTAEIGTPAALTLLQIFPNPFNPSTTIAFTLADPGTVQLEVYDHLGRKVAELLSGHQRAGTHVLSFRGDRHSSGVYFLRLAAGGRQIVQKIMLLK